MDDHVLSILEFPRLVQHLETFCASPLGRSRCRELAPSTDAEVVARRVSCTTEAKRLAELGERLPLAGLHDLGPVLRSLHHRGQPVDESEILAFKETLESATALRAALDGFRAETPRLAAIGDGIADFESLLGRFDLTVDSRGRIRDEASPRLAETRHAIRGVESDIDERMRSLIATASVRTVLREARSYYRNGRHVLPVKAESRGHVKGMIHDSSQSGNTVFVEPEATIALGNRLADLRAQERREISRILIEITRDLLDCESDLLRMLEAAAEVDLHASMASYSVRDDLQPVTIDDHSIVLRRARHPLLLVLHEASDESEPAGDVVPVDVRLGGDFRLLIVTGPNTGGKTVVLKTVGLLAVMHQCGMHLPVATGSSMPVFAHIGADIGDEQSLEQSLSTFSAHMRNIREILAKATRRSLVLLDELGAGTDPAEGAALGTGILDFLRDAGSLAIITTHIGSLKTYAYRNADACNASVEFDVETLAPTYRLLIGQPGNSNAVTIARRMGIPAGVIERAEEELDNRESDGTGELVDELQETLKRAESRADAAAEQLDQASRDRERSEELRADLERRTGIVTDEADRELDRRLREFVAAVEPEIQSLRRAPGTVQPAVDALVEKLEAQVRATPLSERRERYLKRLKKEDWVSIPKFRQKGRVRRVSREKRTVSVLVGAMSIEVPFEEIAVPVDGVSD